MSTWFFFSVLFNLLLNRTLSHYVSISFLRLAFPISFISNIFVQFNGLLLEIVIKIGENPSFSELHVFRNNSSPLDDIHQIFLRPVEAEAVENIEFCEGSFLNDVELIHNFIRNEGVLEL